MKGSFILNTELVDLSKSESIVEIERYKLMLESLNSLISVCDEENKKYLKEIQSKAKQKIDNYNKVNLTVVDSTTKEMSNYVTSSLKKMVYNNYLQPVLDKIERPFNRDDYDDINKNIFCKEHFIWCEVYNEYYLDHEKLCPKCREKETEIEKSINNYYELEEKIRNEFKQACNKTKLPKELINKKILIHRRAENTYFLGDIEKVILENIKMQMLNLFTEQNQLLINKYKNYETS